MGTVTGVQMSCTYSDVHCSAEPFNYQNHSTSWLFETIQIPVCYSDTQCISRYKLLLLNFLWQTPSCQFIYLLSLGIFVIHLIKRPYRTSLISLLNPRPLVSIPTSQKILSVFFQTKWKFIDPKFTAWERFFRYDFHIYFHPKKIA